MKLHERGRTTTLTTTAKQVIRFDDFYCGRNSVALITTKEKQGVRMYESGPVGGTQSSHVRAAS